MLVWMIIVLSGYAGFQDAASEVNSAEPPSPMYHEQQLWQVAISKVPWACTQ